MQTIRIVGTAAALAALLLLPSPSNANSGNRGGSRSCSATAQLQREACQSEAADDYSIARAICLNLEDPAERQECNSDAIESRSEAKSDCRDQSDARAELCDALGEGRYEPDFDPANFDDPRSPTHPNPYFPLAVGSHWSFVGDEETNDIDVLDKVKSIEGVLCLVVSDVVSVEGVALELTDDWFALRKNGDVVYCGEETAEYEVFAGDDPQEPELTSTEGAWKAGRDGDKPGTLVPGTPVVGRTDRQEWSPSNAEDAATVLSTTYSYGVDATLDAFVPQDLAELLCSGGDCLVSKEFSPLDDSFERKYYARSVGKFLEVSAESGNINQLVACNVHALCASLPQP